MGGHDNYIIKQVTTLNITPQEVKITFVYFL